MCKYSTLLCYTAFSCHFSFLFSKRKENENYFTYKKGTNEQNRDNSTHSIVHRNFQFSDTHSCVKSEKKFLKSIHESITLSIINVINKTPIKLSKMMHSPIDLFEGNTQTPSKNNADPTRNTINMIIA